MNEYLENALVTYSQSDNYPFHMPGHKRQPLGAVPFEAIDITEIDGFDNLHDAKGLIRKGQERLARVFGATESFFLVNGSTVGLLAAICGCLQKGDTLLIGRNAHKAVYHAAYLMEAQLEYVYPMATDFGIQGSISPAAVAQKLKECPQIKAVVVTSPTYDGVVSDIAAIAAIVHDYGIPLIVDEAHGAHFGFSEGFPKKAIAFGADLCVESLHKTLPAYTQSSVLHAMATGEADTFRFDIARIKRYLRMLQSSSPSYVLMAGIDRCVRMMQEEAALYREKSKESRLLLFEKRLEAVYERCEALQFVEVLSEIEFVRDASKILISAQKAGHSGQELYDLLREHYHLQLEMACGHYATALTSLMDTDEGFERLWCALKEIDDFAQNRDDGALEKKKLLTPVELYAKRDKKLTLAEALDAKKELLPQNKAKGRIAGEFINLYPPGIPLIVPGEVIDEEVLRLLSCCKELGLEIQGLQEAQGEVLVIRTL